VIAPVVTPLAGDGSLDLDSLRRLLDELEPRVDGVLVLGTTGEQVLLDPDQAAELVVAATSHLAGRVPLYAGVAATGTRPARWQLRRLAAVPGVRAAFVTTGYYFPHPPEEHERHFRELADASELPLVIYNIPQHTGAAVPPKAVHQLSRHPRIVGIKDSSGDLIALQAMIAGVSKGFAILQGREQLVLLSAAAGATGTASALANLVPESLAALLRLPPADPAARHLQQAVAELAGLFERYPFIAVLKELLHRRGLIEHPRTAGAARPIPPPDADALVARWERAEQRLRAGTEQARTR
jgi:4-hydroxy-tetrahydrodipicolinate synthase